MAEFNIGGLLIIVVVIILVLIGRHFISKLPGGGTFLALGDLEALLKFIPLVLLIVGLFIFSKMNNKFTNYPISNKRRRA